jgi:ankyrin repeat protein
MILAALLSLVLPVAVGDAAPGPLLDAIRAGDAARVRLLLDQGADVNARSADGTTALMHATTVGDAALVRLLLDHGADVNAKNATGATALMWAVGDREKVRLLLDRGADVNARADSGRTPLMIAVGSPRAADVAKLLIARGADARYAHLGYTILMAAADGGDRDVVRLLLDRGADVKATNRVGWTALHAAAVAGGRGMAEDLLDRGADVNARETFHGRTPLLWAAAGGRADLVRLLLDRGADTKAREAFNGATALIWAAASERGDPDLLTLLLHRGADPAAQDRTGVPALEWARRRGSRPAIQVLEQNGGARPAEAPEPPPRRMGGNTVAKAVVAALPLLQQSGETFLAKSGQNCVSCHHQSLPTEAVRVARERGFPVDEPAAARVVDASRRILASRREALLQGAGVADQLDAGYWLFGLAAAGATRDDTTDALVHYLTLKQATDGHWRSSFYRPPANGDEITATALAVRGLRLFVPPGRGTEMARRVDQAKGWLTAAVPRTTEDRAFQLLGLAWAGAAKGAIDRSAAGLLDEQRPDGGWGQLTALGSDAYATGQVLVALRQSGAIPATDAAYWRGVRFLLTTQCDDGSWFVATRSLPIQPYFESGFPHGLSQFISCTATSWATMALTLTRDPLRP